MGIPRTKGDQRMTALILTILADAADILILAFVIYKILILLKDNRAIQLVKGIVVVLLLYYVSGWCHLDTVHFLLEQSWSVLLIGIIIIFQPELRNLLAHLGAKGPLFSLGLRAEPKERLIAEIMKALAVATTAKTGMLLVLEGKTGLKQYIETGTPLEAAVSRELLLNIFFKNAPLHDGAVIIRRNRLAGAGCIMPLTDNQNIDPGLGTRHRAALGISEVSDSLVLVVSEESGHLSAARYGKFYRNLTLAAAERMMREFYTAQPRQKQKKTRKRREPS